MRRYMTNIPNEKDIYLVMIQDFWNIYSKNKDEKRSGQTRISKNLQKLITQSSREVLSGSLTIYHLRRN